MDRFLVVGAGAVGASIAYRLADAGANVTIADAGEPGAGTTTHTFAWVGAGDPRLHLTPEYKALNIAGLVAYRRLEAELDGCPGYYRRGALVWKRDAALQDEVEDRVRTLREIGYSAVLLSPRYVRERFADPIIVPDEVKHIGFFPDDGHIIGAEYVSGLLARAVTMGLEVVPHDAVVELSRTGSGGWNAVLASGRTLSADVVVSACGATTNDLLRRAGADPIPMIEAGDPGSIVPGLIVQTQPLPVPLRRVVIGDEVMARPAAGGAVALHDYSEDLALTAPGGMEAAGEGAQRVIVRARNYLKPPDDVRLASYGIGFRPMPADQLPAVGWVPGVDGLYVVASHSGMTLGALYGELVSAELLGDESAALRTFRPERFTASDPDRTV